jgi:hypothetical protein
MSATSPVSFVDKAVTDMIHTKIDELVISITAAKQNIRKLRAVLKDEGKVLTKARTMFYHDNKDNPAMLADICGRLQQCGLYASKMIKKKDGTVVEKPLIPFVFIRKYTDAVFATMEAEAKERYLNSARNFHVAQLMMEVA